MRCGSRLTGFLSSRKQYWLGAWAVDRVAPPSGSTGSKPQSLFSSPDGPVWIGRRPRPDPATVGTDYGRAWKERTRRSPRRCPHQSYRKSPWHSRLRCLWSRWLLRGRLRSRRRSAHAGRCVRPSTGSSRGCADRAGVSRNAWEGPASAEESGPGLRHPLSWASTDGLRLIRRKCLPRAHSGTALRRWVAGDHSQIEHRMSVPFRPMPAELPRAEPSGSVSLPVDS
jgi:hypothetical protein